MFDVGKITDLGSFAQGCRCPVHGTFGLAFLGFKVCCALSFIRRVCHMSSSYLKTTLSPDESIVHETRISWFAHPGFTSLMLLLALPTFGLSLLFLIPTWIRIKTTEIAVTSRRVLLKRGLMSRHTVELNLSRIESVQVSQGVIGTQMDFGDVVISGAGNPQAPMVGICNPIEFRRQVLAAQQRLEDQRSRRRD